MMMVIVAVVMVMVMTINGSFNRDNLQMVAFCIFPTLQNRFPRSGPVLVWWSNDLTDSSPETNLCSLTMQTRSVLDRDGRGRVFSCGAGRGKGQNLSGRGRPGQSKVQNLRGGARVKISGAGQNVSISADLDHLLKEGKPLFEYNSII